MTTPGFDPQPCCQDAVAAFAEQFTTVGLCLGDGTPVGIVNRRTDAGLVVQDGWVNLLTGAFAAGPPPVGTGSCGSSLNIQTSDVLCDITTGDGTVHGLVLIAYHYNEDGSISSTDIIDATTGAAYVPVGTVTVCPTDTGVPDNDMQVLCDRQADGSLVPFVRDYRRDVNAIINGFSDYTLNGAPYTVTGTVQSCVPRVSDSAVFCDANGTRFLRTYTYASSGMVQSVSDTTLAGAAFVPVGAVGLCPQTAASADLDFVEELLCDSTGAQFIRRFTLNSATGGVVATADLTLSGAAFVPVGAVSLCPVTTVQPTITAQARALTAGQTWTPGTDVTGTLTALTLTVTSGTAGLVDQNGTGVAGIPAGVVMSWSNDDEGPLLGPQSITANPASAVLVHWTQR